MPMIGFDWLLALLCALVFTERAIARLPLGSFVRYSSPRGLKMLGILEPFGLSLCVSIQKHSSYLDYLGP